MSFYIAYLDLLGTKGFCEDEELYYNNINRFSNAVEDLSPIIGKTGKIGIFSDCVYIECAHLEKILQFLTELRNTLIGDNLFFNAALTSGKLGVESVKKDDDSHLFGVRFTNKEIAGIYCKQINYRGVGIWIDPKILTDVNETSFKLVKSIYYSKEKKNGKTIFEPREYDDIAIFDNSRSGGSIDKFDKKRKKCILSIIIKVLYCSHCKSPNYSAYYISLLINIIRTCNTKDLIWNRTTENFEKYDIDFSIMYNFLFEADEYLSSLVGLDNMVLALLNQIFISKNITSYDKSNITELFMKKFSCLKKYIYSLDTIPSEPFTEENKKDFINYCNENMARKFVDGIMDAVNDN